MRELLADKRKEQETIVTKKKRVILTPSQINPPPEWQKLASFICLTIVVVMQAVMSIINMQDMFLKIVFSSCFLGMVAIMVFPISWQIKSMKRNHCYVYGTIDIIRRTNCHQLSTDQIITLLANIPGSSYADYKEAVDRAIRVNPS